MSIRWKVVVRTAASVVFVVVLALTVVAIRHVMYAVTRGSQEVAPLVGLAN